MKISGSLVPVPEKLPHDTGTVKNPAAAGKTAVGASVKSASQTRLQINASSGSSMAALIKQSGLPIDRLSASIISFARFFSLPLNPAFLANIRRMVLAASNPSAQGGTAAAAAEAAGTVAAPAGDAAATGAASEAAAAGAAEILANQREALSFAALAAADKGLELTTEGLEEYAAAIDGEGREGRNNHNYEESGKKENSGKNTEKQTSPPVSFPSIPSEILMSERFLESQENTPLLALLNRLPGKNGQRWMVFPFNFSENGILFRVILKIMLDREILNDSPKVRRMDLDISKNTLNGQSGAGISGERWLFIMDNCSLQQKEHKEKPECRLTLMLKPPRRTGALKSLAKKLSKYLEMPAQNIVVKNLSLSPFMVDNPDDLLHSINKEV